MRIHAQDPTRYICLSKRDEERDILTKIERTVHTAIEVTCPRCDARPGLPCRQGGTFMPKLAVHIERQERAL